MTDIKTAAARLLNAIHDLRLEGENTVLRSAVADFQDALAQPEPPCRGGGGAMTWQPINTAPTDAEILASDYDAIEILHWEPPAFNLRPGAWVSREGCVMFPAWWQPLPNHPPLPDEEAQP
jgi:hypothetical protein